MPITLNGTTGITTPTYNGSIASEYLVPVTGLKNRIINGAMVIDQRNAGASFTPTDTQYTLDRWRAIAGASSKFSVQRSTVAPTGFSNSLLMTSLSAYTPSTSEAFGVLQRIEGFNCADLMFGTANAKTVTVSFWVRSSITGTFSGFLNNQNFDRAYPFTYTISAANTWEQKSVTVAGDTSGTWGSGNDGCIGVGFSIGAGSNFTAAAGAWTSGNRLAATGQTNFVGANGATFYITGVQLEVGTQATSFEYRQYQQELALCQRYLPCFNGENHIGASINFSSTGGVATYLYQVQPRVPPTGIAVTGTIRITIPGVGTYTVTPTFASGSLQATTMNCSGSGMGTGSGSLIASPSGQIQFTGCEL